MSDSPSGPARTNLFDLYDRMIGEVDLSAVLRDVADVVCADMSAERASIYLIDTSTQELVSAAVVGNVARTIRVPIRDDSLSGYCALTARAFVVPDAYGDLGAIDPRLRFDRRWDEMNHFRTRDVMCAPAVFKGDVLGVVQVINRSDRAFCGDDLEPLQAVSRLIGYALYHARLYDDLATLKRLDQEKADFMRIMVHELKSPVSAAKMMADVLLAAHGGADPKVVDITGRIAGRMDQLGVLIQDILSLAKVKSGDPLGDVRAIDLGAETREGCEAYREQADAKGLALTVDVPDTPLVVRFDSQGLRMVLSNLVSNAVKYTAGGSVTVALRADGDRAVLQVTDTGMGIPEADIPRLFREFFRASNAKKSRIPGSGVGLSGVKQLVERFGGTMELASRENEGSTFTVRLPISADEAAGISGSPAE
jgi:signal transduction histidine kinase